MRTLRSLLVIYEYWGDILGASAWYLQLQKPVLAGYLSDGDGLYQNLSGISNRYSANTIGQSQINQC